MRLLEDLSLTDTQWSHVAAAAADEEEDYNDEGDEYNSNAGLCIGLRVCPSVCLSACVSSAAVQYR